MKKITYSFLALVVLAIGALLGYNWLRDNKLSNFRKQAEIYIYPETTAEEALEMIADKAKVISRKSLERCFQAKQVADYLTPGHYTVSPGDASVYVARMLNNGWQTPVRLSLSGNLRIKGNIAVRDKDIDTFMREISELKNGGYGKVPAETKPEEKPDEN